MLNAPGGRSPPLNTKSTSATPAPSPFSASLPTFQVSWDSTSLGWFKTCPRYYYFQMIQQWSPRSKGIHLTFGQLYATGVETYAKRRAAGDDHDNATIAMVRRVLCDAGTRDDTGWHPWESGDPIKNRVTLVRSLVWNVDEHKDGAFKTVTLSSGRAAVELSFNFPVFEVAGQTISLSGHMDSLVTDGTRTWVLDDKTTKGTLNAQYFNQWTPSNQMSLYTIAGEIILSAPVSGVLVRAAQIGVNFTRFATQQCPRPSAIRAEWLRDTEYWINTAYRMALDGHWPANDKACDRFGGCPFRAVCAVSPAHRDEWLRQDFTKHTWNPLIARGGD